jgi:hypothetical protein
MLAIMTADEEEAYAALSTDRLCYKIPSWSCSSLFWLCYRSSLWHYYHYHYAVVETAIKTRWRYATTTMSKLLVQLAAVSGTSFIIHVMNEDDELHDE